MTTIAFDDRVMAADSQQTRHFIHRLECEKIFYLNESGRQVIIGFAGDLSLVQPMLEWFKRGADPVTRPGGRDEDNFLYMLFANENGVFEIHTDTGFPVKVGAPYAIGSGAPYAMGAMLAGADARKAVEIAIKLDANSGGNIRAFTLYGAKNVTNNHLSPTADASR